MRILLLGAFKEELDDIFSIFTDLTETTIAKRRCTTTRHNSHEIVISLCGIGTIAASSTTTALCEVLNPDLIIMCGVAGGLDPSAKIGDLILADKIIDADLYNLPSILQNTPYQSCLTDPHTMKSINNEYIIDARILETGSLISVDRLKAGTIVTSNIFPAPESLFSDIKKHNCSAIEMKSVGVFKAAEYYDIPVMTIRAISNLLDDTGADLGTEPDALSICSKRLALFLTKFLMQLPQDRKNEH